MQSNLAVEMNGLLEGHFSGEMADLFKQRIKEGGLTKEENQESHLCAYFAACDYRAKMVFIGHHIKSGLWLFNGGHVDKGETLSETVAREIDEEWGLDAKNFKIEAPALLTLTPIYNPTKQPCRAHYDVWHFIDVDKNHFVPDPAKLAEEFHVNEWTDLSKARQLITDKSTLTALDFIEANYF